MGFINSFIHLPQNPRIQGQIYFKENTMKSIKGAKKSLTTTRRANHIYAPYTLLMSGVNIASVFDIQSSVIGGPFHLIRCYRRKGYPSQKR